MAQKDQMERNKMIVLLPECLAGNLELGRTIHQMALSKKSDVLYLTLVDRDDHLLSVSRQMVTMKAFTAGDQINVNSRLATTSNWVKTLKSIYHAGDQILCHSEQTARRGLLKTIPLDVFLKKNLNLPVQTISGHYHPQQVQFSEWLHILVFWIGFLLIFGFFTLLEIQVDHTLQGYARVSLFLIVATCEAGILWTWNNLIRQ